MQLKTFSAPTLQQALQKAKLDLGEDAMIVATSFDKELGVARVTAGVEQVLWIEKTIKMNKKDLLNDLEACLDFHGVSENLFVQLMTIAGSHLNLPTLNDILSKALETTLSFSKSNKIPKVISLVGLPGAGKTSTTARLALYLKNHDQEVTIVSLDHFKAGAYEQIVTYADIIDVNLEIPETPEQLKAIIKNTSGAILIDTPGVNPFSSEDKDFLKSWIGDSSPIWVNPVSTDMDEARDYSGFFSSLGVTRQLITKTDLCRKLGSTLSFLIQEDASLTYWSDNPKISSTLQEGTPDNLAALLLQKYMQSNKVEEKNGQ